MARTSLVTGAGSGIGRATVEVVRERGGRAVGVDLRDADLLGDLSSPDGRREAARQAVETAGGSVDAVAACAGISLPNATP